MFGHYLVQSIATQPDTAEQNFDALKSAIQTCRKFTSRDKDGTSSELTLAPLSFPKLGDDTLALRLTGTSEIGTIGADLVAIRFGKTLSLTVNAGIGAADGAVTEQENKKAAEKISAFAS